MPEWRVYGCGSASSSHYCQTSYEFVDGERRVQIDFGNGALYQRCRREGSIEAAMDAIEHIFMSHSHPDHTIDLTRYVVAWKFTPGYDPKQPIHLHGSLPTLDNIYRLLESVGFAFLFDEIFETHEMNENEADAIAGIEATPFPVQHMEGSLGLNLKSPDGIRVAYIGDTSPFEALSSYLGEIDLLVLEASFFDYEHPMHLNIHQVGELAAQTQPRALLLVHPYPEMERAPNETIEQTLAAYFEGQVFCAQDGMALQWDGQAGAWRSTQMF